MQPSYSDPISDFTKDLESDDESEAIANVVPPLEAARIDDAPDSDEESFSDAPETPVAVDLDEEGLRGRHKGCSP